MAERKNYPLRLDPGVYEALRVWADDEMRSVNAQIEFLLSAALRQAGRSRGGKIEKVEREDDGRGEQGE